MTLHQKLTIQGLMIQINEATSFEDLDDILEEIDENTSILMGVAAMNLCYRIDRKRESLAKSALNGLGVSIPEEVL